MVQAGADWDGKFHVAAIVRDGESAGQLRSLPRGCGKLPMGSARLWQAALCALSVCLSAPSSALSPRLRGGEQDAGGMQAR